MRLSIVKQLPGQTRYGFFQNIGEHDGFGHYLTLHLWPLYIEFHYRGRCWKA